MLAIGTAIASLSAHAEITLRSTTDTPLPPVFLRYHDLATVLATPHAVVPAEVATPSSQPQLVWVRRGDLAAIDIRNTVASELANGRAILVTGPADDGLGEAATFGFRASGTTSIYWQSHDGTLDVTTVDADLPVAEATEALTGWLRARFESAPTSMEQLQAGPGTGGDGGYVPRVEIRQDRTFPGGRAVRHHIVVLRDIDSSRDEKVVLVTAEVDQAPGWNGALWNGSFLTEGAGYHLFVPDRYVVTTQLAGVGQPVPLTLQDVEPKTDGAIDRTINETVMVKTSAGMSASFDILEGLAKNDAPHLGKIALGFNAATERTEQSVVTMTLKDYSVESSTREGGGSRAVDWVFPLAPDIARDYRYFEDGQNIHGALNSTRRMTPMMRRATLQTTSVWRLPGDYEGELDVTTRATVDNRIYLSLKRATETEADPDSDIFFTTRIDLGSPHLTRQPTIRLQSLHGLGECLTQREPRSPDLSLDTCEKGAGGKNQHWYLEADNTYRNRGSGQCLTTRPDNGEVHAAECSGTPLNQQWKWSADRIHSLYMGGGTWRLHVRDGALSAMFDPARHQEMVSNQYHPLLRPWSSYPNKPSQGDVVPNLAGTSPQIPESYLEYNAVGVEERWQPQPVRVGL
jgi:hypothetical protein